MAQAHIESSPATGATARRYLRPKSFAEALGVSLATLYVYIEKGHVPRPIKLEGAALMDARWLDNIGRRADA